MKERDLARLAAEVDAALSSEDDFEPLWDALGEAIAARPEDPALRRLRIRLAEACHAHATHIEDLTVLRRLDPGDRAACLQLALLQHRWAFLLVPDDDNPDDTDVDDASPADEPGVVMTVREPSGGAEAELQRQALQWLGEVVESHAGDADFCHHTFQAWSEAGCYAPWLRLRLALLACARHPGDGRLSRVLAAAWDDLANQLPDNHAEDAPLPMGFLVDNGGGLWDSFLLGRAIQGYDALLAGAADPAVLRSRGRLLEARCDFLAAAADFDAAATALKLTAMAAGGEAREEALAEAAELEQQAALCRGGRAALTRAQMEAINLSMAQLTRPLPSREDASEESKSMLADVQRSLAEGMSGMAAQLDEWQSQQSARPTEPTAEELDLMRASAHQIAAQILRSLTLHEIEMVPLPDAGFEQPWDVPLAGFEASMEALGWQHLGWVEWPGYRELLGHQAASTVWRHPGSCAVAIGSVVKGLPLVDLETELEDGHVIVTALARGRNFLTGGPDVDTLFVEPALPISEACSLHEARVALAQVLAPHGDAKRPLTLADVRAMQERIRQLKVRFRFTRGLTADEALGVPTDYPEHFAPLLRAAVGEGLTALQAATHGPQR